MRIENCFFEQNGIIIKLAGELDLHTVDNARQHIDKLLSNKKINRLLLDLENISFIDSSGIGLIIGRYKRIQQMGGTMELICSKPQIKKILEMSGIGQIINIYKNQES